MNIMYEVNLNIEDWSMVESSDQPFAHQYITDVVALADYISQSNTESFCDINLYNYTH